MGLPVLTSVTTDTELDKAYADFEKEQADYLKVNGKYKQYKPVTADAVTQEVHEYVCPDRTVGYQVFVTAEIDGKKMTKSFGKGKEASSRDFDWTEVKEEKL